LPAPDLPEPPHRRHGGSSLPRWLEWTTALSALVISVCSIGVALYNANIESRLLKANSYPYLVGVASDSTEEGKDQISIDLYNNGVGPADEQSLTLKVRGRYVTSLRDLYAAAVGPQDAAAAAAALHFTRNNLRTRFVAAHGSQFVFRIPKTDDNAVYWEKLDASQSSWLITYCYCSVFQECWKVTGEDHSPVKACKRDEPNEFNP
jgi:hypothetical protein